MYRRRLTIFLAAALALLSSAAAPQPQRSVAYERYDVDIHIQRDGTLQRWPHPIGAKYIHQLHRVSHGLHILRNDFLIEFRQLLDIRHDTP